MKARIRYLSAISAQPRVLARFYQETFGMAELRAWPTGDVSLTDGAFNLTLLNRETGAGAGLSRLGIAVNDLAELRQRLANHTPAGRLEPADGGTVDGECSIRDPNGQPVEISTRDFGIATDARHLPGIRHVAICVPHGDEVAGFFVDVCGLQETGHSSEQRKRGEPNRFLTDGVINLAILSDRSSDHGPLYGKSGVNHFGFGVKAFDEIVGRVPNAVRTERPGRSDLNEYQLLDPDDNHIDLRLGQRWAGDRVRAA